MLGAVMFGHRHFQPVIDMIIRLAEKAAKEPRANPIADARVKKRHVVLEGEIPSALSPPKQLPVPDPLRA